VPPPGVRASLAGASQQQQQSRPVPSSFPAAALSGLAITAAPWTAARCGFRVGRRRTGVASRCTHAPCCTHVPSARMRLVCEDAPPLVDGGAQSLHRDARDPCIATHGVRASGRTESVHQDARSPCIRTHGVRASGRTEFVHQDARNSCIRTHGIRASGRTESVHRDASSPRLRGCAAPSLTGGRSRSTESRTHGIRASGRTRSVHRDARTPCIGTHELRASRLVACVGAARASSGRNARRTASPPAPRIRPVRRAHGGVARRSGARRGLDRRTRGGRGHRAPRCGRQFVRPQPPQGHSRP
jgi:hypothetical protein